MPEPPPLLIPRPAAPFRLPGSRWRFCVFMGLLCYALFWFAAAIESLRHQGPLPALRFPLWFMGLIHSIVLGTVWGIGVVWLMERRARRSIDLWWTQTPPFDSPQPSGADFSHRLICTHALQPLVYLGGVLYIGRDACVFVPHRATREMFRAPIQLPPSGQISAATVARPPLRSPIARFLYPGPRRPLLRLTSGSSSWDFDTDDPEAAADRFGSLSQGSFAPPNPSPAPH